MTDYKAFIDYLMKKAQVEFGYPPEQIVLYPEGYTSEDAQVLDWIRQQNMRYFHEEQDTLMTDFLVMYPSEKLDITECQSLPIKQFYDDIQRDTDDSMIHIRVQTDATSEELEKIFKRYAGGYPEIRNQLIIRPLNYTLHIRDLHGAVYIRVGDFALVLYQVLGNSDGLLTTSKIKQEDLESWGLEAQKDKVMYDALVNTARLYPASVYDKRRQKEIDFMKEEIARIEDITINGSMTMITTFNTTNGAVALFYPGVVEKLLKLYGKPFLVVFMNVNDVMLFELNDPAAWFFVQTAGESSPMGEMLSSKCYRCDKDGLTPVKRKL